MATPFDGLTIQKATRLIPALDARRAISKQFLVHKDHWQAGEGYMGPRPDPREEGYQEFMVELARIFVAVDALLEIVVNRREGVVGRDPNWYWTPRRALAKGEKPTKEEQDLIDEANALSTTWWNERGVYQTLREAIFTLLWAERAGLRLLIPAGMRLQDVRTDEESGIEVPDGDPYIEARDFAEALDYVYLDHPAPDTMVVWEHPETKQRVGIYRFVVGGRVHIELSYFDEDAGKTVLRQLAATGTTQDDLALGKRRLTMHEVTHPEFITPQMHGLQRALNFALLLLPHNLGTSSFVERTLLNAQMPGDWDYDEQGNKIPGTFQPQAYRTGPRTTNFVRGIEMETVKADGTVETTLTTPSIDRRDPAPVTPVVEGKNELRRELFRSARQEHLSADGAAEASGDAYEQRRAAFLSSLNETADPAAQLVRWVIETSMALAEDIRGQPGHFTDHLRVECALRIDRGPVSADEQQANWAAAEQGAIPYTEALTRNGVDDPDAALAEVAAQPWTQVKREQALAEMVAAWTTAGASLEGALSRVRKILPEMTEQEVRDLLGGATEGETGVEDPVVEQ